MEIKRYFTPGSRWLYLKLYTGIKTSDILLTKYIYPFLQDLLEEKVINKYFFIRYYDPDFHLRLRLDLNIERNFSYIFQNLNMIFSEFISNGLLKKIQCDTYMRELERYGVDNIECIENLFYIDSESIITFLEQLTNYKNMDRQRWLFALIIIDHFMNLMKYSIEDKYELVVALSNKYCDEFDFNTNEKFKQLNRKYQKYRKIIEENFQNSEVFEDLLKWREKNLYSSCLYLYTHNEIPVLNKIVGDVIHMMMNRLFCSRNRLCEMVIYYFFTKYYRSLLMKKTNLINE